MWTTLNCVTDSPEFLKDITYPASWSAESFCSVNQLIKFPSEEKNNELVEILAQNIFGWTT